jgi:folate-binding protein YgfZ
MARTSVSVAAPDNPTNQADIREGARVASTTSLYLISPAAVPNSPVSMPQAFVTEISHNALIGISGDDAAAFLHGQFTNDVEALAEGQAQWNGWCTAKGRLLATFLLARRADGFLLMLPAEIAEPVRKRLQMFVLRSKVKLEDAGVKWRRFGITGPGGEGVVAAHFGSAPALLHATAHDETEVIRVTPSAFVVLAPVTTAPDTWEALAAPAMMTDTVGWDRELIRAGIPTIVAATQEAFVPQMVNFELLGGVSFKKGCYPGQEIVARMHYRGGLKRRMALAHLDGPEVPKPGDSLYSASFGEQAAGEVANVAPALGGGFDALVVAQIESLSQKDLRWRSPSGPAVALGELPYAI